MDQAEVNHLVDLVTVNSKRERAPEARITHELSPGIVIGVEVRVDSHLRADTHLPKSHHKVVPLSAFHQKRKVIQPQIPTL